MFAYDAFQVSPSVPFDKVRSVEVDVKLKLVTFHTVSSLSTKMFPFVKSNSVI